VGHPALRLAAACALGLACATGCASLYWDAKKALRQQGARLEAFPEQVAAQYDCAERNLPFFKIERSEVVPPRVRSGGEFNHRMVTVLCPARATEVERGRLLQSIRFRGDVVHREETRHFEIRPGRWVVDAFVDVPADTEPGVYAYELHFEGPNLAFDESWSFVVEPR
jgi:hypothetical protein